MPDSLDDAKEREGEVRPASPETRPAYERPAITWEEEFVPFAQTSGPAGPFPGGGPECN